MVEVVGTSVLILEAPVSDLDTEKWLLPGYLSFAKSF